MWFRVLLAMTQQARCAKRNDRTLSLSAIGCEAAHPGLVCTSLTGLTT